MDPDEDFELIDSEVEDSDIEDNEDIQTSETKISLKPTNLFNATTNINEDNDDMDDDTVKNDIIYIRYDDSNLNYIYVCTYCNTSWTNNNT